MQTSDELFTKWIEGREDEHLEFKTAKNSYSADDLVKYCFALANELGQVQALVRELKNEMKIFNHGRTRAALWHFVLEQGSITSNSKKTE